MLDPWPHIRQLYCFQKSGRGSGATLDHCGHGRSGELREAAIRAAMQLLQPSIVNTLLINNLDKAGSWIDVAGVCSIHKIVI